MEKWTAAHTPWTSVEYAEHSGCQAIWQAKLGSAAAFMYSYICCECGPVSAALHQFHLPLPQAPVHHRMLWVPSHLRLRFELHSIVTASHCWCMQPQDS